MKFRQTKLAHFCRNGWLCLCFVKSNKSKRQQRPPPSIWSDIWLLSDRISGKKILSGQIWVLLLLSQEIVDDDARDHSLTTHTCLRLAWAWSHLAPGVDMSDHVLNTFNLVSWQVGIQFDSFWSPAYPRVYIKELINTSFSLFVCIPCMYDDGKGWYLHTRLLPSCIAVNEGQK